MSWSCPACRATWRDARELVAAFNAMTTTLLNRTLWATPVTRLADVLCCPNCLHERGTEMTR